MSRDPARTARDAASRREGIREAGCLAVMNSGETYIPAFALLLHATPFHIGLLAAIPNLAATGMQLASLPLLAAVAQRKVVVLAGIVGQAIIWIPLVALPLVFPLAAPTLVIVATAALAALGGLAAPAWTGLLTSVVEPEGRSTYFGRRARAAAVTGFVALAVTALVLHAAERAGVAWVGFAVVFLAMGSARAVSAVFVSRIDDGDGHAVPASSGLLQVARGVVRPNFCAFLAFCGLMYLAAAFAGPYFAVYLLRDLRVSYLEYGVWQTVGALGQFLTFTLWGRLGDRFGNKTVLTVTGLAVPAVPLLYLLTTQIWALVVINFVGQIAWAGLNLGMQNYVFDANDPQDRPAGIALLTAANAVGWGAGALTAGWLASAIPPDARVPGVLVAVASNVPILFLFSGLLRLLFAVALLGRFDEVRRTERLSARALAVELGRWRSSDRGTST